jgi:hypothetical protein
MRGEPSAPTDTAAEGMEIEGKRDENSECTIPPEGRELCIVTTACGEREMRWSVSNWCFYYTSAGTPIVCPFDEIQEWRPAARFA